MKRYGIFPILGDGTGDNYYRAAPADLSGVLVSDTIATKPDGSPKWRFAFCNVGALDFSGVNAISNSYLFPDYALDAQLSGMDQAALLACKQSVEAYDVDGAGTHFSLDISDLAISWRALLISLYKQFDPLLSDSAFNLTFDPGEPQGGA